MAKKKSEAAEPKTVLTTEDKRRLDDYIDASIAMFREIDDRREAQSDLAKVLAEELGWKPAELVKAAKTAYKGTLRDETEKMDRVSMILELTGHGFDSHETD